MRILTVGLQDIYNQMENFVIMHNLNVPMTSVPGEVWSEEKKAAVGELDEKESEET